MDTSKHYSSLSVANDKFDLIAAVWLAAERLVDIVVPAALQESRRELRAVAEDTVELGRVLLAALVQLPEA